MGVGSLHIFYLLNLSGDLRASSQRLATLGIYYQNYPFFDMFQLKFFLNAFETCSLLYVCVLKFSILAIILFEYLLLDPSANQEGAQLVHGAKKFQRCTNPCTLILAPMGPPSSVTLMQQCFKSHCYIAANKPCIKFLKTHFFLFFSPGQWEVL